jgi:hypothetical protein
LLIRHRNLSEKGGPIRRKLRPVAKVLDVQKANQKDEEQGYGEEEPPATWQNPDRMVELGEQMERCKEMSQACWKKKCKIIGWVTLSTFLMGPLIYTAILYY